ncbi:MAG TPA: hypothetical protein VE046_03445 [Steroidobacteraceae bacterium]|nr:hypothetical protein [Steroidobacteraceae bacterium]
MTTRHTDCHRSLRTLSLVLIALPCSAQAQEIVTWGPNDPAWIPRLGLTEIELGCSGAPAPCMRVLASAMATQKVSRWVLSMTEEPDKAPSYSLAYGAESLKDPRIVGVSIDDFILSYSRWMANKAVNAPALIHSVIDNLHSQNPSLEFGITLYEDELSSSVVASLPASARAGVDRVSLYVRARPSEPDYARFVEQTRTLFPNASIWGGSYVYDRIDYWPCNSDGTKCTAEQQQQLYSRSIDIQASMLKHRAIQGIEFYPGGFGQEDGWHGWNNPKICRPERRQECVKNTKALRAIAIDALNRYGFIHAPGPTQD